MSTSASPRRSLVTGAASGIGLAIARQLVAQGHAVLLADRAETLADVASGLAQEHGHAPAPLHALVDLDDPAQTVALAATATARLGGVDVLVNCAGISPKRNGQSAAPTELALDEWERVMRINLTAPFLLSRELLGGMQARGFGRIVNIASRAGRTFVAPAGTHYAASKAALLGLTRHLAGVYAPHGITVNAVAPGRIETPLSSTSAPDVLAAAVRSIPAQRLGTPDEIAAAVAYLVSDGAAYVTGACLDVNGGVFMG